VDDAPHIRDLFGRFLTSLGMAVTFAEDGVFGFAQAPVRVPDVIVSDLDMPNMKRPGAVPGPAGRSSNQGGAHPRGEWHRFDAGTSRARRRV
jgi:DNA-binding NtrC family response regulator